MNTEVHHYNALKKNTLLQNKYQIQKVLGTPGGFGIAYLAINIHIDKKVVIKEYLPDEIAYRDGNTVRAKSTVDKSNLEYGLEKFKEEAKVLVKFNHPNIVKVLDYFEENDTAYFVMDFEEGEDLDEYLKKQTRQLTQDEILSIIVPILDGLKEVHSFDFLHRDIKPGNIYIRTNGSPMLIDFGAARNALGQKSKSLTQILTPGYAPTEQYGSDIDKQGAYTDIYSIGAVLYKLVTNTTPIDAPDRSREVYEEENRDPLISATEKGKAKYSKEFLKAIDWALEIRSRKRPQNVVEFRDKLMGHGVQEKRKEETQQQEPKKIEKKSKPKIQEQAQVETPKKQNKLLLIIIGVVVLIVGISFYQTNQNNEKEAQKHQALQGKLKEEKRIEREKVKELLEQSKKEEKRISLEKEKKKNSKKVWKDPDTNLTWQVQVDKTEYNWSEAKQYCKNLSYNKYNDWRLPNKSEIKSILAKESYPNSKSYSKKAYIKKPLLESMDMRYQFFWSSTEYSKNSSKAWVVGFSNGNDGYDSKSGKSYVRCVRGGQ